jgi:hypothetical protein
VRIFYWTINHLGEFEVPAPWLSVENEFFGVIRVRGFAVVDHRLAVARGHVVRLSVTRVCGFQELEVGKGLDLRRLERVEACSAHLFLAFFFK